MDQRAAAAIGRAMTEKQHTGARGEDRAADYLRENGFELLHRNWRTGRYELDIVAQRGQFIHFVEVKTRRAGSLTTPEEALTPAKFRSLLSAARAYMAIHRIDAEAQFDLIAIEGDQLRYIPNAMSPAW